MTKRVGDHQYNGPNKKGRLEDDLDELWGEDPDIEDIDDCFMLATQQVSHQDTFKCTQTQRNNVSILPSYSGFKEGNNLFCSTQSKLESSFMASTSTAIFKKPLVDNINQKALQERIYKLEEELQTKDGEVSILRSKLNSSKTASDTEFAKRQTQFNEKHEKTNKELKVYKSELEFKNLEISNLRKRFTDMIKFNNLNSSVIVEKQEASINTTVTKSVTSDFDKNFKTSQHDQIFYPLKITEDLFSFMKDEMYVPLSNHDRINVNSVPLLENENRTVIKRPTVKITILKDKSYLSSRNVLPELVSLSKCNNLRLDRPGNEKCINKILFVLYELLHNMNKFLQEVEENMQPELVAKLNSMYLENKFEFAEQDISIYDSREWCSNELGISCRQIISFLADIFPYNSYLRSIILENKSTFGEIETLERFEIIPRKYNFLELILVIINSIGKQRLTYIYPGFLSSIVKLLGNLLDNTNLKLNDVEYLYKLFKEIVFTRPSAKVLVYIANFLRQIKSVEFLNLFCIMPEINGIKTRPNKNFVLFSKDCCIMQVFCNLYTNQILSPENFPKYIETDLNILNFVCNLYKFNLNWLFSKDNMHPDCINVVSKMSVNIMLKNLEHVIRSESHAKKYEREIFNCSLYLMKVLKFNSFKITIDSPQLSDYQKIVFLLESRNDLLSKNDLKAQIDISSLYKKEKVEVIEGLRFKQKYWA